MACYVVCAIDDWRAGEDGLEILVIKEMASSIYMYILSSEGGRKSGSPTICRSQCQDEI